MLKSLTDLKQEDFVFYNARLKLEKCAPKMFCFNDDVQGTGCVTVAATMAVLHVTNPPTKYLRILFSGAGSADIGRLTKRREGSETACSDQHVNGIRSDHIGSHKTNGKACPEVDSAPFEQSYQGVRLNVRLYRKI